ncbi:MAG: hypothetical protein F6J95_023885 [Leptolyngbya sp. SIO1E4]|nr:hypothetical protein [Leptolyngbya sp. SIO1E4]
MTSLRNRQILVAGEVHEALAEYAHQSGGTLKGFTSIAIAEWLRGQGVDIEYPAKKPKAAA